MTRNTINRLSTFDRSTQLRLMSGNNVQIKLVASISYRLDPTPTDPSHLSVNLCSLADDGPLSIDDSSSIQLDDLSNLDDRDLHVYVIEITRAVTEFWPGLTPSHKTECNKTFLYICKQC